MKKFTFMLLAAFIAVASWASLPSDKMVKRAPMQVASLQTAPAKQVTPKEKAASLKWQAMDFSQMAKSKAKAKQVAKAPLKRAGLEDLMSMQWMLCSDYYSYDETSGGLVPATISAGGTPIAFELVDATTVSIEGFISGASETITATFEMVTDAEMLEAGIVAEISIPDGQKLMDTDYGPIILTNVSGENEGDPIKAYVFQQGYIMIQNLWAGIIGGDGDYAGWTWTDYCHSMVFPVNGTMTCTTDEESVDVPVVIQQDPDTPKYVYVYNFAGYETAISVKMNEDKSFVINEQPVFYYDSTYGYFYVSGLLISSGNYYLQTLTGVGTENTLTFDCNWMLYSPTKGSIYEMYEPATITMAMGEFVYPVIPDVAAVPADPEILKINNYDETNGYGSVAFVIQTTDADGNDLKENKLYYQLYSDINGDIQPITFTTDLYIKIEEDMSIIPYSFTDNYDFADNGTYKVVFLNYNFNTMYDRIGVKSIYKGGDETNESNIVWADVEKTDVPEPPVGGDFTFNFNTMNVETSSNSSTAGDINEDKALTAGNVTLTISPKVNIESFTTPNRFWGTTNGPQLRVYSGTLTFEVPEGSSMTQIVFNAAKWGSNNSADCGEIEVDSNTCTWTGDAQTVVFTIGYYDEENEKWISGNSQINSIVVTVVGGDEPSDPDGYLFTFDDGTLQGWTTIDADDDGNDWTNSMNSGSNLSTHNDSEGSVYSESYSNEDEKALTPDNFLVSPKIKLDGSITFYACAQDASYPSEHFAVCVSTKGNESAEDFETVEEWTMTASRADNAPSNARGMFRSARRVAGSWYKYSVDLSGYDGAEGYVAIRHFDCTDYFILVVDDITLATSWMDQPDYVITPAEGTVKSLSSFKIKFNNYDVILDDNAKATLTNMTAENSQDADVELNDNLLSIEFDEVTAAGEYQLVVEGVMEVTGRPIELTFNYIIEEKPVVVVLPEGVEAEEWSIDGSFNDSNGSENVVIATEVAFDGNDVYVKGIPYYFGEAWMKGTLNAESNIITFPSGQFVGEDDYGWEFMIGSEDFETICDIQFAYDAEAKMMTQLTPYIIENGETPDEISAYGYWSDMIIYAGEPVITDPIEAPEGLATESYQFKATEYVVEEIYDDDKNLIDTNESWEDYEYQTLVGFDGTDVYFNGVSDDTSQMWLKGTLSEDGKTVTIPANQYMGQLSMLWFTFDYYFTAVGADMETMEDIVLNYDAETHTFTTDQILVLHDGKRSMGEPYQTFKDVVITKMDEFAATPADPEVVSFDTSGNYPKASFDIPAKDTEGNVLLKSKLFYTVWVVTDAEGETPFIVTPGDYKYVTEEMEEIPYTYDDSYDIYAGGSVFYINPVELAESIRKIGVQSIYYGGGECNKSNIIWSDGSYTTGIADLNTEAKAVYYDLQGRKIDTPKNGLFIKQYQQANGKVKSVKVVR